MREDFVEIWQTWRDLSPAFLSPPPSPPTPLSSTPPTIIPHLTPPTCPAPRRITSQRVSRPRQPSLERRPLPISHLEEDEYNEKSNDDDDGYPPIHHEPGDYFIECVDTEQVEEVVEGLFVVNDDAAANSSTVERWRVRERVCV